MSVMSTRCWYGARGAVAIMVALGRWRVLDGSGRLIERRGRSWFVNAGTVAAGPFDTLQAALDAVAPAGPPVE